MRKIISSSIILATSFSFLSACKIAKDNGGSSSGGSGPAPVVLSQFTNILYAFEDQLEVQERQYSSFSGAVFVSESSHENSFLNIADPFHDKGDSASFCLGNKEMGIDIKPERIIEVGNINISNESGFTSGFKRNADSPDFGPFLSPLSLGNYKLKTDGFMGSLSFAHEFRIPEYISGLKIDSAKTDQTISNAGNEIIHISRNTDMTMSWNPDPTMSYTKMVLTDRKQLALVCYFKPSIKGITIPATGIMDQFTNTNQAYLMLDYVQASRRTDIRGLKESMILSTRRLIHGKYSDSLPLGEIIIEE